MDPGRKKNETRTADFVAVGDTMVIGAVLWQVESFESWPSSLTFNLTRQQGDRTFTRKWHGFRDTKVLVRNVLTPQS